MKTITRTFTNSELVNIVPYENPHYLIDELEKAGFLLDKPIFKLEDPIRYGEVTYEQWLTTEHLLKRKFGPSPNEIRAEKKKLLFRRF